MGFFSNMFGKKKVAVSFHNPIVTQPPIPEKTFIEKTALVLRVLEPEIVEFIRLKGEPEFSLEVEKERAGKYSYNHMPTQLQESLHLVNTSRKLDIVESRLAFAITILYRLHFAQLSGYLTHTEETLAARVIMDLWAEKGSLLFNSVVRHVEHEIKSAEKLKTASGKLKKLQGLNEEVGSFSGIQNHTNLPVLLDTINNSIKAIQQN